MENEKWSAIDYLLYNIVPLSCVVAFFVITLSAQNDRERLMASDIIPRDDMRPRISAPMPDGYRLQDDKVVVYP